MKKALSLRQVNILLLIVIFLELGNAFLMFLPQFVRMILNEALFIALPALLLLRMDRQPVKQYMQWRWPGWKLALLSLAVGAGLYPITSVSTRFYIQLLGYQDFIAPPDAIPSTVLTAILGIIAYAVMAPICEEILFRGVIQRTYELHGFKNAFWFIGLLFMMFHLSLLQGLSIIPLCIVLGFVYARTRSLPASMLTHFGANGLASIMLTSRVFFTEAESVLLSQPAIYGGLALAIGAVVWLWLATRKEAAGEVELASAESLNELAAPADSATSAGDPSAAPAPQPAPAPAAPRPRLTFGQFFPLLGVLLIFLPLVGLEYFISRWPEAVSTQVQLDSSMWVGTQTWNYEIRNIDDQPVGEAECVLAPSAAPDQGEMSLTCASQTRAYEINKGSSFYAGGDGTQQRSVRWQREDLAQINGEERFEYKEGQSGSSWKLEDSTWFVDYHTEKGETITFTLPGTSSSLMGKDVTLPDNLWPWMLAAMQPAEAETGRLVIFRPYTWIEDAEQSGPETEVMYVKVDGKETVTTPAGEFEAWKVTVGSRLTAWYSVDDFRLVKYFNNAETWLLK